MLTTKKQLRRDVGHFLIKTAMKTRPYSAYPLVLYSCTHSLECKIRYYPPTCACTTACMQAYTKTNHPACVLASKNALILQRTLCNDCLPATPYDSAGLGVGKKSTVNVDRPSNHVFIPIFFILRRALANHVDSCVRFMPL